MVRNALLSRSSLPLILVLAILVSAAGTALAQKGDEESPCPFTITANPAPPYSINEGDELSIDICVEYDGLPGELEIVATGIPDFVSGWQDIEETYTSGTWRRCQTVVLSPGFCDAGLYDDFLIEASSSAHPGDGGTLPLDIDVGDSPRPCNLTVPETTLTLEVGSTEEFLVTYEDLDISECGDPHTLQWSLAGCDFCSIIDETGLTSSIRCEPVAGDEGDYDLRIEATNTENSSTCSIIVSITVTSDPCSLDVIFNPPSLDLVELDNATIMATITYNGAPNTVHFESDPDNRFMEDPISHTWDCSSSPCQRDIPIEIETWYCAAGSHILKFRLWTTDCEETFEYSVDVTNNPAPCDIDVPDPIYLVPDQTDQTVVVSLIHQATSCAGIDPPVLQVTGCDNLDWIESYNQDYTWNVVFNPDMMDIGTCQMTFATTFDESPCSKTVTVIVQDCVEDGNPYIFHEDEYTAGLTNTIYFTPICPPVLMHQVCVRDVTFAPGPEFECSEHTKGQSQTVTDLIDGHEYEYYITAYMAGGLPDLQSLRTKSKQDNSAPEKVTSMIATALPGGYVQIDWEAVVDFLPGPGLHRSGVVKYLVFRRSSAGDEEPIAEVDINDPLQWMDTIDPNDPYFTGLIQGDAYIYRVVAEDRVGNIGGGIFSDTIIPDGTPPNIPDIEVIGCVMVNQICYLKGYEATVSGYSNDLNVVLAEATALHFQAAHTTPANYVNGDPDETRWDTVWIAGNPVDYTFDLRPASDLDPHNVDGTEYFFHVEAKDDVGNISIDWSLDAAATMDCFPPGDIRNLTSEVIENTGGTYTVRLDWDEATDNASGLKCYHIYKKIGVSGVFTMLVDAGGDPFCVPNGTTTWDYDLPPGSVFQDEWYAVGSSDHVGWHRGPGLPDDTGWETNPNEPSAPTISVDNCNPQPQGECLFPCGTQNVTLILDPAFDTTGVVGFEVTFHANPGDPTNIYIATPSLAPPQFDVPLDMGQPLQSFDNQIQVRARFETGIHSPWSNIVDVRVECGVLGVQTLDIDSDCNSFILTWDPVTTSYLHRYDVVIWECDNPSVQVIRDAGDQPTFTLEFKDTSLFNGDPLYTYRDYCFVVRAVDLVGNVMPDSPEVSLMCNRGPFLDDPQLNYSQRKIKITWTHPHSDRNASPHYWTDAYVEVEKQETANGPWLPLNPFSGEIVIAPTQECEYTVQNDVTNGVVFRFRVRERPAGINPLPCWSAYAYAYWDVCPPAPTNLVLQPQPVPEVDDNQNLAVIDLHWDYTIPFPGVTEFIIERSDDCGVNYSVIDTVAFLGTGQPHDYRDTNLDEEHTCDYYYRLRATTENSCPANRVNYAENHALNNPDWYYTPFFTGPHYFNDTTQVHLQWEWFDENGNPASGTYGAAKVSITATENGETDLKPAFGPAPDPNDPFVFSNIYVRERYPIIFDISAEDDWGNVSPWSSSYLTNFPPTLGKTYLEAYLDITPPRSTAGLEFTEIRALPGPNTERVFVKIRWHKVQDLPQPNPNNVGTIAENIFNIARWEVNETPDLQQHTLGTPVQPSGHWMQYRDDSESTGTTDHLGVDLSQGKAYYYMILPEDALGNRVKFEDGIKLLLSLDDAPVLCAPEITSVTVDPTQGYTVHWDFCDPSFNGTFHLECHHNLALLYTGLIENNESRAILRNIPGTANSATIPYPDLWCPHSATNLHWHIKAIDVSGNFESPWSTVEPSAIVACSVASDQENGQNPLVVPLVTQLGQNYPNPFNPSTWIKFGLASDGPVVLQIFDVQGRLVRSLFQGNYPAGHYDVEWDGTDNSGSSVADGVYFYQLKTRDNSDTKKMLLVR